ncbi:response regulator [Paenibacillus beijingensis]|uniref:Response regulator n=1 Tax=Paenibacillus beijingensis TaxID=1126833 RepID=A0A0D5NRJ9_9BACL|nr:response regulator [Paenibacillus beijingensis]AJY77959.1 hypothetical protein VN24_23060 [Paenibacillus beijingensis]
MKLKALLVDDELPILRNLQAVIPWESLGIEVAAVATNGENALEAAQTLKPDLILSDIRMPKMDGILLLERLRERGVDSEVIILTGYMEFEYARSVLRQGARDYVLKPIDYEELERIVSRTAEDIRRKRQAEREERQRWGAAVGLAYEKMLSDALVGRTAAGQNALLESGGLNPADLAYLFLFADLDVYSREYGSREETERKLWNFAVRSAMEETLQQFGLQYAVIQLREGEWCMLLEQNGIQGEVDPECAFGYARRLQEAVRLHANQTISMSVYPSLVGLADLYQAYRSLQLSLHLNPDRNESLVMAGCSGRLDSLNVSLWDDMEQVVTSLKQMNHKRLEDAWSGLTGRLREMAGHSYVRAERYLQYLNLHLIRELSNMNLFGEHEHRDLWTRMESSGTVKELLAGIRHIADRSLEAALKRKSADVLMMKAKDYIDRNIAKDLGIDELAELLGISCSYFSMLFKQHFGETFVEYATRQRMELAQSMLAFSDKSVSQICKQVGYHERRYFTKVFLKYVGVTPSEYRESKKETS